MIPYMWNKKHCFPGETGRCDITDVNDRQYLKTIPLLIKHTKGYIVSTIPNIELN